MQNIPRAVRSGSAPKYPPGIKGYMAWIQSKNPRLFRVAMERVRNPSLAGLGFSGDAGQVAEAAATAAPTTPSVAQKLRDILLAAGQTYLTVEQVRAQQKVLDMNLKRAQQGLAPLDVNLPQYGFTGASASVGLESGTQKFLLLALAAAGAFYLIPKLIRR